MTSKSKTVKSKAALSTKGKPKVPAKVAKAVAVKTVATKVAVPTIAKSAAQIKKSVVVMKDAAKTLESKGSVKSAALVNKVANKFDKAADKMVAVNRKQTAKFDKGITKAAVKPKAKIITKPVAKPVVARSKLVPAGPAGKPASQFTTQPAPKPAPVPQKPATPKVVAAPSGRTISMSDLARSISASSQAPVPRAPVPTPKVEQTATSQLRTGKTVSIGEVFSSLNSQGAQYGR